MGGQYEDDKIGVASQPHFGLLVSNPKRNILMLFRYFLKRHSNF